MHLHNLSNNSRNNSLSLIVYHWLYYAIKSFAGTTSEYHPCNIISHQNKPFITPFLSKQVFFFNVHESSKNGLKQYGQLIIHPIYLFVFFNSFLYIEGLTFLTHLQMSGINSVL